MWIDKMHAGMTRMFNEVQLHVTDILLVAVSISLQIKKLHVMGCAWTALTCQFITLKLMLVQ